VNQAQSRRSGPCGRRFDHDLDSDTGRDPAILIPLASPPSSFPLQMAISDVNSQAKVRDQLDTTPEPRGSASFDLAPIWLILSRDPA